jgi:hypothetical protein
MIQRITARSVAFLAFFCSVEALAQRFENVRTSFSAGMVTIVYDITGSTPDQKFNVEIFGSHNNFSTPLKNVIGDVGQNVSGGFNKQVQWNATADLGTFNGDITFRLRGEVVGAAYTITNPAGGRTLRTGKSATITWKGGLTAQQVKLDLVQNGTVVNSITTGTANSGEFVWQVPSDIPKGNYNLRLVGGSQTTQSSTFRIAKKIPLWLKLSPLVVAGVLIAVLAKDKPTTPGTETGDDDLPNAPDPK